MLCYAITPKLPNLQFRLLPLPFLAFKNTLHLNNQPSLFIRLPTRHFKSLLYRPYSKKAMRHQLLQRRYFARSNHIDALAVSVCISKAAKDVDLAQRSGRDGEGLDGHAHADEDEGAAGTGAVDAGLDAGFHAGAFEDGVETRERGGGGRRGDGSGEGGRRGLGGRELVGDLSWARTICGDNITMSVTRVSQLASS